MEDRMVRAFNSSLHFDLLVLGQRDVQNPIEIRSSRGVKNGRNDGISSALSCLLLFVLHFPRV